MRQLSYCGGFSADIVATEHILWQEEGVCGEGQDRALAPLRFACLDDSVAPLSDNRHQRCCYSCDPCANTINTSIVDVCVCVQQQP